MLVALALLSSLGSACAAGWRDNGPKSIVITYRVAPKDRVAFVSKVKASTLPRLDAMRKVGELESFHVLVNRYVDAGAYDLMVLLDFPSNADLAKWKTVETSTPAGLVPDSLQMVSQIETAPGDMMRSKAAVRPGDPPAVYLIVPYDYLVSTDEYLKYVDGYVLPQTDGWIEESALEGYRLFLPRYAAGRQWSSMLILAYRGDEGLARRDAVVAKVRGRLANTPSWKAWAENKTKLRVEKEPMVAEELQSPAASSR